MNDLQNCTCLTDQKNCPVHYPADAIRSVEHMNDERIICGICGAYDGEQNRRVLAGTLRCDRCWELESRVLGDPELARRILHAAAPSPAAASGGEDDWTGVAWLIEW